LKPLPGLSRVQFRSLCIVVLCVLTLALLLSAASAQGPGAGEPHIRPARPPGRVRRPVVNPYADVNWDTAHQVHSLSHIHTGWGDAPPIYRRVRALYDRGIRHFAFSNYYPSAPYYPLDQYLPDLPDDVITSPNAEHHTMTNTPLHFNSLGSFFRSGSPQGQQPKGVRRTWQHAFRATLDNLQFDDGGGVTINHPVWSKLTIAQVIEMFDYDPRVLGIEVYNDTCEKRTDTPQLGWSDEYWQIMLGTGRFVIGFFVIDHSDDDPLGRNVLLVPEVTEHEALRAYRRGAFYGALRGTARINRIAVDMPFISIETDKGEKVRFITQKGVVQETEGNQAKYRLTGQEVFVRIEVDCPDGERLFSQPIMFVASPVK